MAAESPIKTSPESEKTSSTPVSWAWILQRFSGLLLLVFLGGHLWVEHFMNTSATVVASRLTHVVDDSLDIGLLISVLYHGLNGFRGIIQEMLPEGRGAWLNYAVFGLGLITVVWGLDILWAFWYHQPFLTLWGTR